MPKPSLRPLFFLLTALALLALAQSLQPARAAENKGPRFGFTGPEIFPLDQQIGQLHAADLNGDGLQDLLVVNNARSKITLLYNQTGKTNLTRRATSSVGRELNELPSDSRFRVESIASEKRIASLTVADLNGDGRPDIAYYGEPKELVVIYNLGTNGWSQPKRWQIEDGQLSPNSLTHGDLNGDGRTDLILLAENHIYLLAQNADHTLAEPEKIPFSGAVKSVQVLDINGDGRDDLLLVNWESPAPFRFRLQNSAGQLGPEIHFTFPPVRSYWADDLDGDRKTEIITIAQQSGRAQISNFIQKPAELLSGKLHQGQFQILPVTRSDKARRGMIWADLNGDSLTDLLVAEPDSGQLTLFLQQPDGTFAAPRTFPSLSGISEISVADWNGDGKPDIFLLSPEERQVGVTRLEANGRIPFPDILPLEGRPLGLVVGPLQPGARPTALILTDLDGKRSLQLRTADGKIKTQKLSDTFKSNPSSLALHDVNQDGLADLVVLIPYEKVKILLQVKDKDFEELDIAPPGGVVEQPWFSAADVDGDGKPELLLAQKNFVRAVILQPEAKAAGNTGKTTYTFLVKDQINGSANNSRIVAAAAVPNGGSNKSSLFLLDAERKLLTLSERDAAGVWRVVRNLPLPFTEFTGLRSVNVAAKQPNSLAFQGINAAAWLVFNGSVWEIQELDGYETPIKDGRLMDVVTGDLNNDGRKDLVFLETAKNHLDIVTFEKPHQLKPSDRWQVFEERTFRNRRSDAPEPREALVADFNGDKKNDLVVIVHDRILLYLQE